MCLYWQKFSICRLSQVKREHVTMKVWCLKCSICRDSSDEQNAFDGLEVNYMLVYKLWIPTNTPRGFHISTWNPRGVFVGSGANTLTHDKVIKRSFNKDNLAIATIKSKYNSKDILLT